MLPEEAQVSIFSPNQALLAAKAGAAVLTYDPLGEGERNRQHKSGTRAHDTIKGDAELGRRVGGLLMQFLPDSPERRRRADFDPGDAPPGTAPHEVDEAGGVGLVVDAERLGEPDAVGVAPQEPHARRVEGAHPHLASARADEGLHASLHLVGSLVGEGDGGNALRVATDLNESANFVGDDAGLTRPCTCEYQTRPLQEINGFLLREIQTSRHSGAQFKQSCQ